MMREGYNNGELVCAGRDKRKMDNLGMFFRVRFADTKKHTQKPLSRMTLN